MSSEKMQPRVNCATTATAAKGNTELETYMASRLEALEKAKYAEAHNLFTTGLRIAEQSGSKYSCVDSLGLSFEKQRKYKEAMSILREQNNQYRQENNKLRLELHR